MAVRKGSTLRALILAQLVVLLGVGGYFVVVKCWTGVQPPPAPGLKGVAAGARLPEYSQRGYLAVCALAKDTPEDVHDWLHYHRRLGASQFYIAAVGNDSDHVRYVLQETIRDGSVEQVAVPDGPDTRAQLYNTCLHEYGSRHRWMAFIDVNEYFVLHQSSPGRLPLFLQDYEEFGGVVVNWRLYGSSWHVSRPPAGTVFENYAACAPQNADINHFVKTIGNMQFVVKPAAPPHSFKYASGKHAVDVLFDPVADVRSESVLHKELLLHHYVKSQADFLKRQASADPLYVAEGTEFFTHIDSLATELCLETGTLEWSSL